jgi:two-component system phosphate regulon response regulator PhoB
LRFLLAHPDRVFSRSQLLDKVWGTHVEIEERTVDVHVLRLRKSLKSAESLIKTVRSAGYMLSER